MIMTAVKDERLYVTAIKLVSDLATTIICSLSALNSKFYIDILSVGPA